MELELLDKASNVTPILVRLYDTSKLQGLAMDEKPKARAELTSAVTELLQMDLSTRESELVADVLMGLMRQAEKDLRAALAEHLAVIDNAPPRLILQLSNDDIEVAEPVLRQSNVLDDSDLIYIIKSKSSSYWQAIAKREHMSNKIIDVLAETKDMDTAMTLVENKNITLTRNAITYLSDLSQNQDALATSLLRREEVPFNVAQALYQYVGEELKSFIRIEYGEEATAAISNVDKLVDDVVDEFVDLSGNPDNFMPTDAMLRAAERYRDKGLLTVKLMIGALRRSQMQAFVAQFSKFTGLKPNTTIEILCQPNGQGLAVACKAYEIKKEDFVSIFLLTNQLRKKGGMVDVENMTKATNYFNRIEAETARDILVNT